MSAIARPGVYVLRARGEVVFVGYAQSMLALVAGHQYIARHGAPAWNPIAGIRFDGVAVLPCGPDRAKRILADLIATHDPIHNRPARLEDYRCSAETTKPRTLSRSGR